MKYPLTGVILAGGLNKRFSGNNKAFIRINGKRLLERIYAIFKDLFEEIILVTNDFMISSLRISKEFKKFLLFELCFFNESVSNVKERFVHIFAG